MRRVCVCDASGVGLRSVVLALILWCATSAPSPEAQPAVHAQPAAGGKVLAAARGQVAWLDLVVPKPTPLTQLVRPAYPTDVAGTPGAPFAVASIVAARQGPAASTALGGDLVEIDLGSDTSRSLLTRGSDGESLDLPAIWPDGSGILYQRSDLTSAIPMPGQAQPQFLSRIEQVDPEGRTVSPLLENARYPGPAPDDDHFAFVRSTDQGAGIFVHSIADATDTTLVPPGTFLALAYPRFSPDGSQVAFVAIAPAPALGKAPPSSAVGQSGHMSVANVGLSGFFEVRSALAHGFPWEVWISNADGSGMRQIEDLIDDDPSVTWSPDGTQLLVYGGWGSFVIDAASGDYTGIPYLAGYGSVAWLPD